MSGEVGVVERITTYPLTGARGIDHESAVLGRGGFEGDHVFVLYEDDDEGGFRRVSQKQCRELAQVVARIDEDGTLYAERDSELVRQGAEPWSVVVPALARASLVDVVEFGDATPCHDMGQEAARAFSKLLQREVSLGCKIDDWLRGGITPVMRRANATLHAGLAETVEFLEEKVPGAEFGTDRIRAELIIRGFPALADAKWVNGTLLIGEQGIVPIDRPAKRCEVPGRNQKTGENMKDLPRAYPHTVKASDDKKPTIGVYGHSASDGPVTIHRGDRVRWIPV